MVYGIFRRAVLADRKSTWPHSVAHNLAGFGVMPVIDDAAAGID